MVCMQYSIPGETFTLLTETHAVQCAGGSRPLGAHHPARHKLASHQVIQSLLTSVYKSSKFNLHTASSSCCPRGAMTRGILLSALLIDKFSTVWMTTFGTAAHRCALMTMCPSMSLWLQSFLSFHYLQGKIRQPT